MDLHRTHHHFYHATIIGYTTLTSTHQEPYTNTFRPLDTTHVSSIFSNKVLFYQHLSDTQTRNRPP